MGPRPASDAWRPETTFELTEQLTEQVGEFALAGEVDPGQGRRLVGELLGQDAIDEVAARVGEPDVRDPAVAGVTAALDQAALGQLLQALGDGGTGGERLAGDLTGVSS